MKVHIIVGTSWAQLLPQLFFFCTYNRLSNGSLAICHWALWFPSHQRLQRFDCNNKLVCSISLKVFYSFTNITRPLLRIFGEHSSVSSMLLFGKFLIDAGHKFSELACFFCFFTVIYFPFSPVQLLSPLLCHLFTFSLSLGDVTKWPTRVDVSLNPNNQSHVLSVTSVIQHHSERRFLSCLAFYCKWKYFDPIVHILSEAICLFCFYVLFSDIYPDIKFMVKTWPGSCSFYRKVIIWNLYQRKYLTYFKEKKK